MIPRIALTIGDTGGIASEVIIKALAEPRMHKLARFILVGPTDAWKSGARSAKISFRQLGNEIITGKNRCTFHDVPMRTGTRKRKPTAEAGHIAYLALVTAIELAAQNEIDAIVTGPTSKESMSLAGYNFPGQTELLTEATGSHDVIMILASRSMRVGLVTVHVPIEQVAKLITTELVLKKILQLGRSLQKDFGITRPRIAVLALDPHAGDGGVIGYRDEKYVAPAIARARKKKINVTGPFPADGFFAHYDPKRVDAILAMYHDQGLAPLKLHAASEGGGVNISGNLRVVRTSPDHGTAFAIAGKGIADPTSVIRAIEEAVKIVVARLAKSR